MIELAPNCKRGLAIHHPLLLAAGGYATEATNIGGLVTLPTTLRARSGAPLPRVIEMPGGVLIRTGAANPGWSHVLRDAQRRRAWERSKIPIIVAFASQGVNDWALIARQLDSIAGVGGIELQFNSTMDASDAICAVRAVTELPILAKLDLDNATEIATDCTRAGANALVIGRAPRGMRILDGKPWYGRLYGPAAKPFVLKTLVEIRELKLDTPIIACGGVHSAEDVREFLAAGACAAEIDSAAWIDPSIVARMAEELDMDGY